MDIIKIWEPSTGDIEGVRRTFKQRMGKLYSGWNDEYDRQWDNNSFLFVLQSEDVYLATCRIVIKKYHNISFKTPMDDASIKSFNLDSYSGNICVEGGMVSFININSFKKLMYYVTSWLQENNVDHLFTCYDSKNPLIERLYLNTLNCEIIKDAYLIYTGFTSKKTKKDVQWQVVKADREIANSIIEKSLESFNLTYDKNHYPSLKKWIKNKEIEV